MAKKNQPQTGNEQKIQTKYDRKMEARKKQEEKDKREAKILRISAIVICVAIVAAIVGSIGVSVWNKKAATKDTYVTIGNHEVTKLEYDYFYHAMVNSYSSFMTYMGIDATSDLESQQYTEDLTWKDFFDEMAVEQIKQTKALTDDAAANNFVYDITEEYTNMISSLQTAAESAGVSVGEYYKLTYGDYATEKNMEPYLKEGLLASAYYDYLTGQNEPEIQEIKDYYEQNVQSYDRVDYRSFVFAADIAEGATEEETDRAMMDAKNKADAMMAARQEGADFKELCVENAAEENKETYEDIETDASLREGAYYSSAPTAISDWLYEDGRTQGDITVIEDVTGNQYYIVEFINRYYDEADDENISNTIASQRTSEYVNNLMESYTVVDNKGELKYLTVETNVEGTTEEIAADEMATDGAAEEIGTDNTDEEAETGTAQ